MAASLGDLLQLTDNQTLFGQTVLNVYHYRVTSITGLAGTYLTDIATWLRDNVIIPVRAIQSSQVLHNFIEAKNLSNNLDVAILPTNQNGSVGSTAATTHPSYVTIGFKLIRESLATRYGWKRYSGIPESSADGNVVTISGAPVTNIQNALGSDIVLGAVTVCEPIIYRRAGNPPVGSGYVYASISGASMSPYLGSQNTRKQGVGV